MKLFLKSHWAKFLSILLLIFIIPYVIIIFSNTSNTLHKSEDISVEEYFQKINLNPHLKTDSKKVAIIFGAGVLPNGVSDIFADRLRIGAQLWQAGHIEKILVSGDNRKVDYNEPEKGRIFLLSLGVDGEDIVLDYAGRRTYDTCWRAKNIFGVNDAYLVTQEFHLPRAVFTCSQLGISSFGISASLQSYQGKLYNIFRESLAQKKAFYEVLFFPHQASITGNKEPIFLN